jgi:hypothetical protein
MISFDEYAEQSSWEANMPGIHPFTQLLRDGLRVLLAIFALLVCITMPAQAQFDQQTKNAARRKSMAIMKCSQVLGGALRARAELGVYDELLATIPLDQRDAGLISVLNSLRDSIIERAIDCYFTAGPIVLPAENDQVNAVLRANIDKMGENAFPPTLDDLVKCGIIPHLPASPYAGGDWLAAAPTADPPPGSVLYLAWSPQHPVWHFDPALECRLLVIFGDADPNLVMSQKEAQEHFGGALSKTLPYFPNNVKYLCGQDGDS